MSLETAGRDLADVAGTVDRLDHGVYPQGDTNALNGGGYCLMNDDGQSINRALLT